MSDLELQPYTEVDMALEFAEGKRGPMGEDDDTDYCGILAAEVRRLRALTGYGLKAEPATVKENLTVQSAPENALELVERIRQTTFPRAIVFELPDDSAAAVVASELAATRADERKQCKERAEIQFEIYEHTYDCENAVIDAILGK